MKFNEKLTALRTKSNITKEQLSERLLVPVAEITKWEEGKGYPNIENIQVLATLFQISPEVLFSGQEMLEAASLDKEKSVSLIRNMAISCLDMLTVLIFFIPLFKYYTADLLYYVSLMVLPSGGRIYKWIFVGCSVFVVACGVVRLFLLSRNRNYKDGVMNAVSIVASTLAIVSFTVLSEPYAAIYVFFLMLAKVMLLVKRL